MYSTCICVHVECVHYCYMHVELQILSCLLHPALLSPPFSFPSLPPPPPHPSSPSLSFSPSSLSFSPPPSLPLPLCLTQWFFANYLYALALVSKSVALVNTLSSTSSVFVVVLAAIPVLHRAPGDRITLSRALVAVIR